jgi:hypothetical protein
VPGLDPAGRDTAELQQWLGVRIQESQSPDRIEIGEALELCASSYRLSLGATVNALRAAWAGDSPEPLQRGAMTVFAPTRGWE